MNPLVKAVRAFAARLKAASIAFTNYSWQGWRTDWTKPWLNQIRARQVDAGGSSIVMACVLWLARTFPEAPISVRDGDGEIIKPHPMVQLIARPNPYYSGLLLWMATLTDYCLTGNAYWLKVRSGLGRPVELWYTPSWLIAPKWPDDGSVFITHYEYTANGRAYRYAPADVVHFRYGLNAETRKGVSPLASALGEIFTDSEAANFTGALLKNMGMPGIVISPGADVDLDEDAAKLIKDDFIENFSGDNRGKPIVMTGPTKVDVLSFTPQQMNLKDLRRIPEERVSAALGVPAIVAGLGAGLDRSTFANMAEAREMAYESGVIPMQRLFAAELQVQLLPDFADPDKQDVGFDLSAVRVLQDDQDKLYSRLNIAVRGGWITLAEARQAIAFEAGPEHDLYYVPTSVTVTPAAELGKPKPEPEPMPVTNEPPSDFPPPAGDDEPKGRKARKRTAIDSDEAERIFAERLRRTQELEPAKQGANGRH